MSKFSDYLASQITPQMTLLEKFNLMIKFLQENNYISVFYSQENYNVQTESYQKEKVNLNGFTLHIGDCIVFSNGYYAFVETIGVNNFTIGNVLYFQGEQGVSVVGATISSGNLVLTLSDGENINAGNIGAVSSFSIDENQHLIVHYQNGSEDDLGVIFSGNITTTGSITAYDLHLTEDVHADDGRFSGSLFVQGNGEFGGKLSSPEIVETMTGYSFNKGTLPTGVNITLDYAGVCKNGNKITFVVAGIFRKSSAFTESDIDDLFGFVIPSDIGSKLYPHTLSGVGVLSAQIIPFFKDRVTKTDIHVFGRKFSSTYFTTLLQKLDTLDNDTDYYFRIENTFLLSDNLAS